MAELLFPILAGIAGIAAGTFIPAAGERIMAYKATKKPERYPPAVHSSGYLWLYMAGLGVAWMAAALEPSVLKGVFFAAVSFGMLTITYVDNRYRLIVNECNLAVLIAGLVYQLAWGGLTGLVGGLLAMVCGIFLCMVASLLTKGKGAVGAGDVKLMAACCCMAGMPGFLGVLFYMAITLGVYCVVGLKLRRLRLDSYFPMGGFIAIGLVLSFYPQQIKSMIHLVGI